MTDGGVANFALLIGFHIGFELKLQLMFSAPTVYFPTGVEKATRRWFWSFGVKRPLRFSHCLRVSEIVCGLGQPVTIASVILDVNVTTLNVTTLNVTTLNVTARIQLLKVRVHTVREMQWGFTLGGFHTIGKETESIHQWFIHSEDTTS